MRKSGDFGVKEFSGQGALLWRGGFQQDFRLFPGSTWLAE
jgi:hypothetical protein